MQGMAKKEIEGTLIALSSLVQRYLTAKWRTETQLGMSNGRGGNSKQSSIIAISLRHEAIQAASQSVSPESYENIIIFESVHLKVK